jgi:hypothetical protein
MNCKSLFAVAGLAALAGSIALAQPAKESSKPAQPPASKPAAAQPGTPPGMTEQQMKDMQACMEAGMVGKQHTHLAKGVGTWAGKTKMWMAPGSEPMVSECTSVCSAIMDGRFIKCEISGEMPGMGPFNGFGINGFDNVSQKFVSTWIDNMGTGIMNGTGELSADGKVLTWKYNYNCPVTKKPAVMREVETYTGADTFTLEMFGAEPHTGKEFKMMEIAFTRKSSAKAND